MQEWIVARTTALSMQSIHTRNHGDKEGGRGLGVA